MTQEQIKEKNFNETVCYKIGGKWGFMEKEEHKSKDSSTTWHNIVLPAIYDEILTANGDFATVILNGETSKINIRGMRQ